MDQSNNNSQNSTTQNNNGVLSESSTIDQNTSSVNTSIPIQPSSTNEINTKDITSEQISSLKNEAVEFAKSYTKKGISTRKEPSASLANDQGPYTWWENQATFESDTWSISYWEYDSGSWQLQATKVELQQDGKSRMIAYSMRRDTDHSFPGFQVYKEQTDDRYHQAEIEDIVYLNRVLCDLNNIVKQS